MSIPKRSTHAPRYSARIIEHMAGIGVMCPEYRFHETRKWRFDFAWPEHKIALEVDGGLFVNGGHSRGAGRRRDMEKGNYACAAGWLVFRVEPDRVYSASLFALIKEAARFRREVLRETACTPQDQ